MTHKMHTCNTEGGKGWVESAKQVHGWPYDKVALNIVQNKKTGTTKHETCPWGCGTKHTEMEDVPVQDVMLLEVNPRGSGYLRQPQSTTKAQNAELSRSLRSLTEEMAAMRKELGDMKKKGGSE